MKQQLFTTGDAVSTECAVNTKRRGRLLAMAAGILSVLILLVTAMQFVVSAGADRYSEYSDDCRKFMMDYMKESSSYDTLVNKTYMPYRNYVETLGRDTAFQAEMKAWELATLDLKSAAIQVTNSKEYKYHLGILMDILSDTTQNSDFISSLKNMADACHVSTTKAALKFGKEYNNLNMKLNPQDAKEIAAELSDIDTISSYMSVAGDISDLIEQSKNLDDLLNKLSQAQIIYDLTIGYADMMQDMYNRCDSDNTALKAALLTMRDLCNQSMSKVDMVALFAGSTVAEEAMKIALGEVQKEIVSAMGLTGTAITLAQSVGKMYANILFGTENIQAAYYELNALYNIENLIRESLANTTDADSFFAAFTLYEHVTYKAADYSTKYEEALYTDNIVGKLFAWVTGKDKQLEEYKKSIENCKGLVKLSFDTLQFSAYNAFIESKYTSDVSGYFTVTDKYTLPSEETITQNDENIELLSLQTCGLPDDDYTLDDDLTILNNLYHSSGTIDLNGHTLTINGDLILESGSIDVNGGELIIKGNYEAYVPVENDNGTTSYTGGCLYMNNINDKVTVEGDFNTYHNYYNSTVSSRILNYGTIELKGDLNDYCCSDDYSTYSDSYGLYSNGTKFIFSGTGKQTITALDGALVLKNAKVVNKDVQIDCSTYIDVDVPVRVHDYSDEWTVDVEAACNDGSKSHHCTRCDAKTDITVIPGKGHTVVIDAAVAPSCTEPGLTEGSHCSVCNTVIKAQETVPATGHDFENGICKNCNKTEAETIQSKHPYDNSCDETWTIHRDGATRIDVTFTDETYTESGYDYIYIYDGDDKLIGKYSGSELSGKTISVNSDTVKIRLTSDSSNTEYGFALDKVEFSMKAQCDHSNTEIRNAKSAGCTTEGYTGDTYCKNCGEKISSGEVIPAKGHTEVTDKAVAATCTKTGLTEGIHCSVCDAVIKAQEVVPATGKHSFGNWKITKAATCTAEGTQTRTCSGCGKVETATIAKVAHKYVDTVVKPTYTAQGYTLHKCSVCGTSYKDTYTAKLTLAKVTGVRLGGRAADALRVNWNKDANASGYIVEMYQGNKWVRVAKITSNVTTTYRASGLKASTVYKFRVRAYKMEGKAVAYGAYSTELAARTNPSVMTGVKLSGRAADALRINWTKNTSADGYIVEMYQGNKWVRVGKITNNSTTTFRKAGLKASSVYKFRVRAYKMSGKTALYGNYSATVTARTNPSVVKGVKIGGKAKDALRVNWTKNTSAQGYIVEMYKGGKWVRVAKITNGNTTTFRKAGLAKNTTYKFRVCAYYMSGKTALYGNYGSVSGKTAAK